LFYGKVSQNVKPLKRKSLAANPKTVSTTAMYHMGKRKEKYIETALNLGRIKTLSFLSTKLGQVQ
jgi:hypothetical protein